MFLHPKGPATAKSSINTGIVARPKPWQLTLILNIFSGLLMVDDEDQSIARLNDNGRGGLDLHRDANRCARSFLFNAKNLTGARNLAAVHVQDKGDGFLRLGLITRIEENAVLAYVAHNS